MKNVFKIRTLALIALFAILTVSCDDDDNDVVVDNTITAKASANTNLSILVQALVKADLTTTLQGAGPYTIFAPTNQAFTTFLASKNYASINDVPKEALTQILLNHVISGALKSTDLTTGYIKTLAKGSASSTNTLSMYVNISSGIRLNGISTVTTADVMASNGVIHIVDKVIELPSIVTHATANSTFSNLVSFLNPNLISALSAAGPFTVFTPTDAAFTSLNAELIGGIAVVSSANLSKVLQYHVVSGNVLAASLTEGQVITPPLLMPSQTFTIQLSGGAKIKDARNRISNITITDVQCTNGVIHAIDKVLLPTF